MLFIESKLTPIMARAAVSIEIFVTGLFTPTGILE